MQKLKHLIQGAALPCTVALLAAAAANMGPQLAVAGTIAVASCQNPGGSAAPSEGWTSFVSGSPGDGSDAGATCAPMYALLSSETPDAVGDQETLQYTPDAGAGERLIGGQADVTMNADGYGSDASATAVAYTPGFEYNGSNVFFQCAPGLAPCFEGTSNFSGLLKLPADRGGNLYLSAGCGGTAGYSCDTGGSGGVWSMVQVWWADLLLESNATPAASSIEGPLLKGPVSGTQSVSLLASDPGPGVYRVRVSAEGTVLYNSTPNTNGGHCVTVGSYEGAAMFDYPVPCKTSESVTIAVPTTALRDGAHSVQIVVEDAAGSETVVYNGSIETDNAPVVAAPPAVTGSAQVGATLTGTPARFQAPEGAGSLSAIQGQWLRCTSSEGSRCSAIPGATGSTYSPDSGDVGYYMLYQSTTSDQDGSTTSNSAPTVAVTEPTTGVSGYGSQGNPSGSSGSSAGGAGGSGSSGLTVNITTGSAGGLLGSKTPWKISLGVTPRTARRGSTIYFSGDVSDLQTSFSPVAGKQINLQARLVTTSGRGHHKHAVYHEWTTFKVTQTGSAGRYRTHHTFHLRGPRTYQFRALALPERGYENTTGSSPTLTLFEQATPQSKKRS
jgi:hypothetical protein